MSVNINKGISRIINKNQQLKKKFLVLNDFYYEYRQIILGLFTRFPAYFKNWGQTKVIAQPGTLSFDGGVCNPGAIASESNILLLAKALHIPWYKARGKNKDLYLKGSPITFTLDKNTLEKIEEKIVNELNGFPIDREWAIEDLRLFNWNDKIWINHTFVVQQEKEKPINQDILYSALSELRQDKIVHKGIPVLDFPLQKTEKNWLYAPIDDQLYLFYSLSPYHILRLTDEENLRFETVVKTPFENKLKDPGGFGTRVSLSTNPIEFDNEHLLLIIHQIDFKITGRCYYHWAVLIDKQTMLPVKITKEPIFSGMGARGRTPGIRYISSILKIEDEILFFGGEGDVFVTVAKKTLYDIEKLLVTIT